MDTIERLPEVKQLLRKQDYITVLQQSGDGCIITYPHPKLLVDRPRLIECFSIQRGKKPGFFVNTTFDNNQHDRFVEVPEYAMRLYIFYETTACNNLMMVHPALMVFLNEDGEEVDDIEGIIDNPSTEDEQKKEGFLNRFLAEAVEDGFPEEYSEVAETHHVGEGYHLLLKFYED